MTALISVSVSKVNQTAFSGFNNSRIMHQAQQYADSKAVIIKATKYDDLTAQNKIAIQDSDGYFSEVVLSAESDYSEDVKQRTASINIYKDDDILPRYSLRVLKVSVEEEEDSGGVPVGTIITWISTSAPTEGGTWLLCNGQSCSAYPKLKALIGSTVPNLNGRFLEGTTGTPRTFKAAGLPNITGFTAGLPWGADNHGAWTSSSKSQSGPTGAFYAGGWARSGKKDGREGTSTYFDASRSSAVYGKSTTVQPASYTVRYYIKAA